VNYYSSISELVYPKKGGEKMFKSLRNDKGFTMIEMMVVLIIIAVLIAGGIKAYLGYVNNAKITKATTAITNMEAALDAYYASNSSIGYPTSEVDAGIDIGTTNRDPWGGQYVYTPGSGTPRTSYTLASSVFQIGSVNKVVYGTGASGVSLAPAISAP
jgi:general secretion pathway protein G